MRHRTWIVAMLAVLVSACAGEEGGVTTVPDVTTSTVAPATTQAASTTEATSGDEGVVDATAIMTVAPSGEPASVEQEGPRTQFRDLNLAGTVTISSAQGERSGEIRFAEAEDITFGANGPPEIAHIWGTASATLDAVSCEGSFALSAFSGSGEGGGAIALACDDGSVFAGDLRDTDVKVGPDGFLEELTRESAGWVAASTVDASAVMVTRPSGSQDPVSVDEAASRAQFREATLAGSISIDSESGERSGEISFPDNIDSTGPPVGAPPDIFHVWGIAHGTIDGVSCEGPYALTDFPATGGEGRMGALVLRCDDGSAFAGDLRDTDVVFDAGGILQEVTRESTGWLAAP